MFEHLVVPVDASWAALAAVPIAAAMAKQVDGTVEVVTVIDPPSDGDIGPDHPLVAAAHTALDDDVARHGPFDVPTRARILIGHDVAETIAREVESIPGAMVLMSAHGRGRSAAVLGSTTDHLLRAMYGPIIVVGPQAHDAPGDGRDLLGGTYVVPLDGSPRAEHILPIAGAWAVEFSGTPWLVEVIDTDTNLPGDVFETTMVSKHAGALRRRIDRDVEFDVLHDDRPARAIALTAREHDASLVFMTTHGRTGLERLRSGSVAAGVVHQAHCPVVLYRPPELVSDGVGASASTSSHH